MYVCMYVRMYVCMYVCMRVYIGHVCVYVYVCTRTYVCLYVRIYTNISTLYTQFCGPGSSVGTATGYGLEGPRIESR
jgi:hypothetical protein